MVEVILLRHAEPEMAGHYIGRGSDPGLSPEGRRISELLAGFLQAEQPDILYSSPLKRARETLEPVAGRLKMPIHLEENFSELDFGDWEGLTWKEIEETDTTLFHAWVDHPWTISPPGGETLMELRERVIASFRRLTDTSGPRKIIVATHGGPLRTILGYALQLEPANYWSARTDYGAINRFVRHANGRIVLSQWNVTVSPGYMARG